MLFWWIFSVFPVMNRKSEILYPIREDKVVSRKWAMGSTSFKMLEKEGKEGIPFRLLLSQPA